MSADRPGESAETPVRVATILEITRALSHVLEEGPLFELIMDLVIEHTRAERGFLVLRGADGETIVRTARNVEHENIQRAEREISNSIIEEVFETGSRS